MTFLDTLMKGAVQVHRAARAFVADDVSYPAGTYVVLMAQPFRPFAKDLLEPQRYPDLRAYPGGPPIPPYDTAGWTLSSQMGVRTVAVQRTIDPAALQRLEEPPRADAMLDTGPPGRLTRAWAIDSAATVSVRAINALLDAGFRVSRVPTRFEPRTGTALAPGTWIVESPRQGPSQPSLGSAVRTQTTAHGLTAWALERTVAGTRPVTRPRIGLYKSYVANIDEGWTRWVLEQYGFPYTSILNADVRAGALRGRFDVIVIPSQSPSQITDGHQAGRRPTTPGPWNPPPPEYQGGIGPEGVDALKEFVRDGGRLITLDEASDLVLDRFGGVFDSITDPTRGVPRTEFYCPGSVVRLQVDPDQPLGWGLEADTAAYFEGSRAFATMMPVGRRPVRYAVADRLLMSGWLLGAATIAERDAVLDVPFGRGHVVLFGFRPQFRGQPHGTFKLLFNAILGG
jgi:ribosomal protein S18 acetylase RimI-like enzyme